MIRLLRAGLAAAIRSGPLLFILTITGVALGTASVLSIQILNRSAIAAFEGSVKAIGGEAHLSVLPRGPALDERLYPAVLATPGVSAAWPVCRVEAALSGREGYLLDIVGTDLLARGDLPWTAPPEALAQALAVDGWVAVMPQLAARMGWSVGETFTVSSGSRTAQLRVGALVDFQRLAPLAGSRMVVIDVAQAQALLGRPGWLTQVDVRSVSSDPRDLEDLAERLAVRLGPAVAVRTPEQRAAEAAGLLSAFRLNLTALSCVSLFVGAFLVYSSTQASLVRRRTEFGVLRSLGATPSQVLALVLGEVALVGVIGTALGVPLGYAAAAANVRTVSGTISSLYLLEGIERLVMPPGLVILSAAVGIGGALAGAIQPSLAIARRDTRALLAPFALHERARRTAGVLAAAGIAVLVIGFAWFVALGRDARPAGFILAIAILAAIPLVAPWLVARSASSAPVRSFGVSYGARTLAHRLGITSVTAGALAVAVSMLVGITLMVSGFRRTLEIWVDSTVRADIYVSTPSSARASGLGDMDPDVVRALSDHPAVRRVDRLRRLEAEAGGRRVPILGVDLGLPGIGDRFSMLEGETPGAGAVMLGEPLARRLGSGRGGTVTMITPSGPRVFAVSGVYRDYGSERGSVTMDLQTMAEGFGPGPVHNVALYLHPGAPPGEVLDDLKRRMAGTPLVLRSNRDLRDQILRLFDQTFAVTRLLQAMGLLIAVCGITLALLVLGREREAEVALYRALGAGRPQIFRVFLGAGLGLAVCGMALGAAGGAALAGILVYAVNRAWFGWTIALDWPARNLAAQGALLLVASAAASLYPAWRASRAPAGDLSRDDL